MNATVYEAHYDFLAASNNWNLHLVTCPRCKKKEYCEELRPLAEANDAMAQRLSAAIKQAKES